MNLSRLFVEKRAIGWIALIATLIWGALAFRGLPQRKDPEVISRTAVITTQFPGARAEEVEQLVTLPVEQTARRIAHVDKVTSTTRSGVSTVFVTLDDATRASEIDAVWNDLRARIDLLSATLPKGSSPARVNSSFGETATVTWSIASPLVTDVEIEIRAAAIRRVLEEHRRGKLGARSATVFVPAPEVPQAFVQRMAERYVELGTARKVLSDPEIVFGASFVAVDHGLAEGAAHASLLADFRATILGSELPHPDAWTPALVTDLSSLEAELTRQAHERYGHRTLDDASKRLRDALARVPEVARVDRFGVVAEQVQVFYAQERLAALGVAPQQIVAALSARNSNLPAGAIRSGPLSLRIDPAASIGTVAELRDVVIATSKEGQPLYLRDVADVHVSYETPASDASFLGFRDASGWHRTKSIAITVELRSGAQATVVGKKLDRVVAATMGELPADLVITKTSDQPELVEEKIGDFLRALGEAVVIVIGIALLFMERRSALLVAASIPLTLALTFGFMSLFGVDLQQVSIAALIIALGLLVDDPVIAGDAINREIAAGTSRATAAWLGPTKLAKAILYATLTNTVAFAPLLLVKGGMGDFISSMPKVVVIALVSSRIVSMTFMPLLGAYLMRGQKGYEAALGGNGLGARLARGYNAMTEWMLDHRGKSFLAFAVFLVIGLLPVTRIKTQFFPEETLQRFYVHVRLPEGADVHATSMIAEQAERAIVEFGGERVAQITSFVGNGGPRWWSNVAPEPKNPGYAILIVKARHASDSANMIGALQSRLRSQVPGARFEVYRISSGKPAIVPVEVRISGDDPDKLAEIASQAANILEQAPQAAEVFDDWGAPATTLGFQTDDGRAMAARITRADLASSSRLALSGTLLTELRQGDRSMPVIMRLQPSERLAAGSASNLYVWSGETGRAVPMEQVATVRPELERQKLVRYNLQRAVTVGAIPKNGALASELLSNARPKLDSLDLPAGYAIAYGGEDELQSKSFANVRIALQVSIVLIYLVLVWQFAHAFKPVIVFAAIPFGMVGVVLGLVLTKTNFGFMAFLGVASLIGVIVSHIIVLFDFIEEAREEGHSLHRAVIDAGLVRLRPVLVTVLATVGGLVPLAIEGGPMWRQLVYVQIGGLLLATLVTKGVVPLLYVLFTEDLKLIDWRPDRVRLGSEAGAPPLHDTTDRK